jgi:hypothetical protein
VRSKIVSSGAIAFALLSALTVSCGKEDPSSKSRDVEVRLEQLKSVPYTFVTPDRVSADTMGVMLHNREMAWPGYNFYCSRIAPEAFLLDMDGEVVHTWSYPHEDYFVWDYAILLGNGDIIVLNKFQYIFQLDWDSNLRWEKRMTVHHDVVEAENGTLFVIELRSRKHRDLLVRFTNIVQLDSDRNELRRWSSDEHLQELKEVLDTTPFLDTVLDLQEIHGTVTDTTGRIVSGRPTKTKRGKRKILYDYFHINTITILPETPLGRKDPRFAPGNLLICLRNVDQIATINWDTGEVLWGWGEGTLERPHHPTMLPNGNILVFDNGVVQEASRVLEIDPVSETIVWEYRGDPPASFFTPQMGSSQRLPNGNTLICEADKGRVFEVTMGGEIVWEWYNPLIKKERRAQLYRMIRHPIEMVEPLLAR